MGVDGLAFECRVIGTAWKVNTDEGIGTIQCSIPMSDKPLTTDHLVLVPNKSW